MKTLVNKHNPAIRITAPEIIEEDLYYTFNGEIVCLKSNWTLVEEEPNKVNCPFDKGGCRYCTVQCSGAGEEFQIDRGVLFSRRYITDEEGNEIQEVRCYGKVTLLGEEIHMKDELLKVLGISMAQLAAELWEGADAKMEYLHGKIDSLKQVRKWLKNYGQSEDGQGS